MKHYELGDSEGIPAILHFGSPGCGDSGAELHELATQFGIRLICPTRPWYDDEGVSPSFEAVSRGTINYLEAKGIDAVHAIGGSGGGPFALHLALWDGSKVKDCTLLAAMGSPREFADHVRSPYTRRLLEIFHGRDYQAWQDTMAGWGVSKDLARGAWQDFIAFYDSWPKMELRAAQPIYVYHGSDDQNAPLEAVRALTKHAPLVEWNVMDAADHLAMAKDPANMIFASIFQGIADRRAVSMGGM
ncbi:alpha/beta fold hydrolase [Dyella silvae]|uniref:alpha/beta fold hydrolase n=1 Tax=Dyella silvae TaxID=2994424 RepID=UPI002264E8C5|nr:hypothetical protein [Dyella silvae]